MTSGGNSEFLLEQLQQRIRQVREGPDGLLYALTDDPNAALLRIEPVAEIKKPAVADTRD